MPVDSRDIVSKEVANSQHTPHPSDGAQHIVRDEFAKFHLPHAGDHWRKRPDDGNELGDHDCSVTIPFLEFMGTNSMLLVEEKAVFPIEDPRTRGVADEIAERIAYDCSDRENRRQLVYIQISVRGEQAGGNKQGVAG
jgi:hypothetical protein